MKYLLILTLIISCSSRELKKEYKVLDASHQEKPEWINEPVEWAEDEDENNFKSHKYYVFTTELKNSRVVACEVAKLRANSEIASEVSQSLKHTISTATEGDSKDLEETLDEYVDEVLTKKVESSVVGATVVKKYWEKVQNSKKMGAKNNFKGFTCSVLVRIAKKNLKRSYDMAFKKIKAKTKNAKLKSKINEAQKNFKL